MSDTQQPSVDLFSKKDGSLRNFLKDRAWLFTLTPLIILIDQTSKWLVRTNLVFGEVWSPWVWLTPFARIVHWYNTGVAFGFFQNQNLIFSILSASIAVGIIWLYPRVVSQEPVLRLALALQLGGAIGNLIDRITLGHVTDFISVGDFAVFNVADSAISVGVVIMLISILVQDIRERKKETESK